MQVDTKDSNIMKLMHYFITSEHYNPVLLHGLDDEIWLENMNSPYKVVRIVNHYIHNNEQLDFDIFKFKRMLKSLQKQTFCHRMKVLNIYVDLGDNVNLKEDDVCDNIYLNNLTDLNKKNIIEVFPDIIDKTQYQEKGIELYAKLAGDINEYNRQKSLEAEKLFGKRKPIITYLLIAICVIMFASMYIFGKGSYDNLTLLKFGANLDILVKNGDYYRLLTCAFLHIGIMHLLLNMYALYVIGPQVESFYGKFKFIIIYIISAISGSMLSIAFSHNVISAGASGAIFGLLGSLLYFGYYYRPYLGNVIRSQILPLIIINLIFGFIAESIDNAAHIGGLIGGILASVAVGINNKESKGDNIHGIILLAIYLTFIIYLAFIR